MTPGGASGEANYVASWKSQLWQGIGLEAQKPSLWALTGNHHWQNEWSQQKKRHSRITNLNCRSKVRYCLSSRQDWQIPPEGWPWELQKTSMEKQRNTVRSSTTSDVSWSPLAFDFVLDWFEPLTPAKIHLKCLKSNQNQDA